MSDSSEDYHSSEEYHSSNFSGVENDSGSDVSLEVPQTVDDSEIYDESLEPVPNEEEAAEYLEQLQEEDDEEQLLLSRFSGEIDVTDW